MNRETLEWVKSLPSGESWEPVLDEVFQQWSYKDSTAMIAGIETITDSTLRERLAVHAVGGMRTHGIGSDDTPKLAQLMMLITDPEVRKRLDDDEDTVSGDPFADGNDPFATP